MIKYLVVIPYFSQQEPTTTSDVVSRAFEHAVADNSEWAIVKVNYTDLENMELSIVKVLDDPSNIALLEGVLFVDAINPVVARFNRLRLFDPIIRNVSTTCTIAAVALNNPQHVPIAKNFPDTLQILAKANLQSLDMLFVPGTLNQRQMAVQLGTDPYVEIHPVAFDIFDSHYKIQLDPKTEDEYAAQDGKYFDTDWFSTNTVDVAIIPPYSRSNGTALALTFMHLINHLPEDYRGTVKFRPVLFGTREDQKMVDAVLKETRFGQNGEKLYDAFRYLDGDTDVEHQLLKMVYESSQVVLDVGHNIDVVNPLTYQLHKIGVPVLAFSNDCTFGEDAQLTLSQRKRYVSLFPDAVTDYLGAANIIPLTTSDAVMLRHAVHQDTNKALDGLVITAINKIANLIKRPRRKRMVLGANEAYANAARDVMRRMELFYVQRGR